MKIDAVYTGDVAGAREAARQAKACGYSGLWTPETKHDPFMTLLRAAETEGLEIGTAIAVALSRSPMTLAQSAWDLAAISQGRFWLGLGSQVKAHITRRFSMPWEKPVEQMREMIAALRAIWDTFQNGAPLKFTGQHYKLSLMTPFFNPGPIDHPHIPIGLAAVGPAMTALAGETADFVVLHPFTNMQYLDTITRPSIENGLSQAGRGRSQLTVVGSVFCITGDERTAAKMEAAVRQQVSFYGSTPDYAGVLEAIGHADLHKELHQMSRTGQWEEMARSFPSQVLEQFCVRAPIQELPGVIAQRFGGYYDRVMLNVPVHQLAAAAR